MKIWSIIITTLVISCASPNNIQDRGESDAVELGSKNKIIFLTYRVYQQSGCITDGKVVDRTVTEGLLKKSVKNRYNSNIGGEILCSQVDNNLSTTDSFYLPSPINHQVEYVTSSGELNRKTVELDSADFTVRMQLNSRTRFIILSQINSCDQIISKIKL